MPNSRHDILPRVNADRESNSSEKANLVDSRQTKSIFQKFFGGGLDQILSYAQLNQSYRICGYTFKLIGLLYSAFFSVLIMVSLVEIVFKIDKQKIPRKL